MNSQEDDDDDCNFVSMWKTDSLEKELNKHINDVNNCMRPSGADSVSTFFIPEDQSITNVPNESDTIRKQHSDSNEDEESDDSTTNSSTASFFVIIVKERAPQEALLPPHQMNQCNQQVKLAKAATKV